jgi:hypothetical protein
VENHGEREREGDGKLADGTGDRERQLSDPAEPDSLRLGPDQLAARMDQLAWRV